MLGLEKSYSHKGFGVLCFPCNQFNGQEPGTSSEIQDFVNTNWPGNKFVMMEKSDVNGDNTNDAFECLKENSELGRGGKITWNFGKFLCSTSSGACKYFGPNVDPDSMISDIEKILNE